VLLYIRGVHNSFFYSFSAYGVVSKAGPEPVCTIGWVS